MTTVKYQVGMAEYSARMLEDHLNEMNDVISNEKETIGLLKDPERIDRMDISPFKSLSQAAYTYYAAMEFIEHKIKYENGKFRVVLIPFSITKLMNQIKG